MELDTVRKKNSECESLEEYEYYVWFIDGDIPHFSMNWHAFFKQVRIMRPKISQPASINDRGSGSVFKTICDFFRRKGCH